MTREKGQYFPYFYGISGEGLKEKNYFIGGECLSMDYVKKYSSDEIPSQRFIAETIRKNKLQTRKAKKRRKGGSEYLLYPTESARNLGYIHQSADFIGKKYISGKSEPINIFSACYHAPIKLYQIQRILAEKTDYAIEVLIKFWQIYPIPDVFRIDNALPFRGTARGKRSIGKFLIFLLSLGIAPLLASPSNPWTNPNAEGHNRVFNEKVWSTNHFTSLNQIDAERKRFNCESEELHKFKYSNLVVNNINIFKCLEKGQLSIYSEYQKARTFIKKVKFKINN